MAKQKEIVVPSSPADLKKIYEAVHELSNSMTRQDSEKKYQNETIDELSKEYNVPASEIRRMANDYHKDTYKKHVDEFEDYQELYEATMQAGRRNPGLDED